MKKRWFGAITLCLISIFVHDIRPDCVPPSPIYKEITEDAFPGTEVFVSKNAKGTTYMFETPEQSDYQNSFFDLFFSYKHDVDTWILEIAKQVDLDTIKKGDSNGLLLNINIYCVTGEEERSLDQQHMKSYSRKIFVKNVDEFEPAFPSDVLIFNVTEDTDVHETVVKLSDLIFDKDYTGPTSPQYSFSLASYDGKTANGSKVFNVMSTGEITLRRSLDYEKNDRTFSMAVIGQDTVAKTARTTLVFRIINLNDNPIIFENMGCVHSCMNKSYAAKVPPRFLGLITEYVHGPIHASDADGDLIVYSFVNGSIAHYKDYVVINNSTAEVIVLKRFDIDILTIEVKAEAMSILGLPKNGITVDVITAPFSIWIYTLTAKSMFGSCDVLTSSIFGTVLMIVAATIMGHTSV